MFTKNRNRSYTNGEITIFWQGEKCTHSTLCYSRLRTVFDPVRRPWINPNGATTEQILAIIEDCPSEALSFRWNDESRNEGESSKKLFVGDVQKMFGTPAAPKDVQKDVSKDAPQDAPNDVSKDAQSTLKDVQEVGYQADAQHLSGNRIDASEALTKVDLRANGPIVISGDFEVVDSLGEKMKKVQMISLCRCGASSNMPYCDGTHFKIGFRA